MWQCQLVESCSCKLQVQGVTLFPGTGFMLGTWSAVFLACRCSTRSSPQISHAVIPAPLKLAMPAESFIRVLLDPTQHHISAQSWEGSMGPAAAVTHLRGSVSSAASIIASRSAAVYGVALGALRPASSITGVAAVVGCIDKVKSTPFPRCTSYYPR